MNLNTYTKLNILEYSDTNNTLGLSSRDNQKLFHGQSTCDQLTEFRNSAPFCQYCNRILVHGSKYPAYDSEGHDCRATVDHIIPVAVLTWTDAPKSMLRYIDSPVNCIAACYSCNVHKASNIPTKEEYLMMAINGTPSEAAYIYDQLSPYIEKYKQLISDIYKHTYTCAVCGQIVYPDNLTLRRRDHSLPRGIDNVDILCKSDNCHAKYSRSRKYIF